MFKGILVLLLQNEKIDSSFFTHHSNLTTFENFRHKIFTTLFYYINIPTNNPNNTFSFLTPYLPAAQPAGLFFLLFYKKKNPSDELGFLLHDIKLSVDQRDKRSCSPSGDKLVIFSI
jgi:hypothetical protein